MSEFICAPYFPVHGELCETCNVYYANKMQLWKHVRYMHGADQRLICPKPGCGKRFSTLAMSVAHTAHHRVADERPLACELCGRLLSNLRTFERHMTKSHPGAMAAMCGVCHLYAGDVSSLIDHVRHQHGSRTETSAAVKETVTVIGMKFTAGAVASTGKQRDEQMRHVYNGNYSNIHKHREVHDPVEFNLWSPSIMHSSPKPYTGTSGHGVTESIKGLTETVHYQYPQVLGEVCKICYAYCIDKTELFKHARDKHATNQSLDATAKTSTTTRTISARIPQLCVGQIKYVIRCDVCGKQYGNYSSMYKHRLIHGIVEFDPRSPFVSQSFLRHRMKMLQQY